MSLPVGSRIGAYEIIGLLGAGGMGEVFRATDTKLHRAVALKVLPPSFAADAERVARFRREAQVLASLNHPNIAAIYGLEESPSTGSGQAGAFALVMELVEGEDLSARMSRGPLPVDEATAFAAQIVDALEAAHDAGVVHRDLKPANIKVRPDGRLKVLDFGLAKAFDGSGSGADLANSPTITVRGTEMGTILGTAAYMAPEQARGKPVDKRADIFAFGIVLFEMLTGKQLFAGETMSDTLAAVLTREPAWATLPAATPSGVRRLLARCLERDPKKRLRDIGDARVDLHPGLHSSSVLDASPPPSSPPKPGVVARGLPWAIAVVALLVAGWAFVTRTQSLSPSREVMYVDVGAIADVEFVRLLNGGFGISPDGRSIVIIGVKNGARRLYIVPLGRPEAREIPDTIGVNGAVFSPDGGSVAFVTNGGELVRLTLADQQRTQVATGVDQSGSFNWSAAGIAYNSAGALWLAPIGGAPRQLTTLDASRREVMHTTMFVMPDGKTVLFSSMTSDVGGERIESVATTGGARTVLVERASTPVFVGGHLLFSRDGALLATPFDEKAVRIGGAAIPIVRAGVMGQTSAGGLAFRLAKNGTMLFAPADYNTNRLVSVGRDGAALNLDVPPSGYMNPRVSPNGRRLLIETGGSSIESVDLERGTFTRLTAPALGTSFQTWLSDGERVLFRRFNVPAWVDAGGTGKSGLLPGGRVNDYPAAAGPDADSALVVRVQPESTADIYLMSLTNRFEPKALVATRAYEGGPQLSPDGKWLLHQSNESGTSEIYVRRYPHVDRAWPVSAGGGVQPRWNPATGEVCYRGGGRMMAVPFNAAGGAGADPVIGKPQPLFADEYDFGQGISIPNYDITRDGRFIMLRRISKSGTVRAIVNWTEELKQIIAAGGIR